MGGSKRAKEVLPAWGAGTIASNCPSIPSTLGWGEITHPFHPLRGQKFVVLKLSTFRACRYYWTMRISKHGDFTSFVNTLELFL
jgi:Family of unknown function (DUF5372)